MHIRQASQNDAQALSSLILSSAPVALAAIFDINDELSALNFLHSSLLTADGQYGYSNHWVVQINKQVVACLTPWHSELSESFHTATLTQLTRFYGIDHALTVVQASLALQDCMPKPQKHEWCIGHFSVLAQYQRQGVATALLKLMQQQALTSGKTVLSLDVGSDNSQAINFYLRQGFIQKSESILSPQMQALGIAAHLHLSKVL